MADTDFTTLASTNTLVASDQLLVVRGGVPYRFSGALPAIDGAGRLTVSSAAATSAPSLVLSNSTAANAANVVRVSFMANNSFGGAEQIASITALNPNAAANNGGALSFAVSPNGTATTPTEFLRIDGVGLVRPGTDNVQSLGAAAYRWSTVYAGSGTINTSDEREKAWRGGLNAKELAAAKAIAGTIGIFRFNDAVAEKKSAARLHTGVKAQEVVALMKAAGLDPMRYAFVCHDKWKADKKAGVAAGDRYGIRYDELAMFLAAAQEQRLAALEARG